MKKNGLIHGVRVSDFEDFPFDEILEESHIVLVKKIIWYFLKKEDIRVRSVTDDNERVIVFMVGDYGLPFEEDGLLTTTTNMEFLDRLHSIETKSARALEFYVKLGIQVKNVCFFIRAHGIP